MGDETATAAPTPTAPRRRAPKTPDAHQSFLEQRFFIVGLIWLFFALGLASYVIFGPPLCSPLKVRTFTTVLSLSAGFLAWTFSGAISAKTRNLVSGIAIVATGGFAVFLVLQFQFAQDDMRAMDPRCTTTHDDEAIFNYYAEIAVHTSNVVQQLTEAKSNQGLNRQVFDQALTLKTKIDSFPKGKLDDLQKGILSLYAAQATTALAMTLEPVSANASDARAYSKEAAEHARAASEQLTKLMSDTGKLGRAAIEHVSKYKSLEKAAYLLGIALILDTQWAQLGSMKVSYSDEQIATPFKQLPATFLKEISAASDPPVVWFCTAARKELAPCTKL